MTPLLEVSSYNDRIELNGDLSSLKRPKNLHWLRNSFDLDFVDSEKVVLRNKLVTDNQFLFNFKVALQKRLSSVELIFDSNFSDIIIEEERRQENFEVFSRNAREIWRNNYDPLAFQEFCDTVGGRLNNRKLYRLQILSAYHMSFAQNSCNFSVPGAGKTSIVYSAYAYLNSLGDRHEKFVNKLLIVGPPSSFEPWEQEYYECFGSLPKSIRITGEVPINLKRDILKGVSPETYDVYLITYQSLPNLKDELTIFLKAQANKVMMVCDEAHKFKSLEGIWAGSILEMAEFAKSRIVLTGTPAPNGYEDLYNIFKFIYPERNVTRFRPDFLRGLTKNPMQSVVNELIENIKPFFVRIKKSDLRLPPFVDHPIIYNHLSGLESEVYDKLEAALANSDSELNKQSIHFRMIQCCNNLKLLNKPLKSFVEGNFDAFHSRLLLEEVLGDSLTQRVELLGDEYIPSKHVLVKNAVLEIKKNGGKVILWGIFIDSIKKLNSYLKSFGLEGAYIIGETKKGGEDSEQDELSRENIIRKFKNSELDFIISNPIVLGESISLHKVCHHAIYFEQWYSAGPYVQSRDRIHRVWLDKLLNQIDYETNYYHIVSDKRADLSIHNRVQAKFRRMVEMIEQDIPFFREELDGERSLLIQQIIDEYRLK